VLIDRGLAVGLDLIRLFIHLLVVLDVGAVFTPSITSSPRSEIVHAFARSFPLPPKPTVRKLSNCALFFVASMIVR
jgi:hypothetical protein